MTRTLPPVGVLLLLPLAASAQGWPCGYYPPPVVIYWQPCPVVSVVPPQVRVDPTPAPAAAPTDKAKTAAPPSAPQTVTPVEFKSPAATEDTTPRLPKADLPTKPSTPPPAKPTVDPPAAASEKKTDSPAPPAFELKLPPIDDKAAPPPARPDPGLPGIILPKLPPAGETSESKYRPAEPTVQVLPVDGPAPDGDRQVGFFNYTGREIALGVGGKTVAVPARSYVTAKLPAAFTWKLDGGADRSVSIPADSAGVEIVIK